MLVGRFRTLLAGLALAAGPIGCNAVETVPGYVAPTDGPGRPILSIHDPHEARYTVESGVLPGYAKTPVDRLASGLRVGLAGDGGLPGTASATGAEHGVPVALPVGTVTWPTGGHVTVATDDPLWSGAEVRVEWMLTVTPSGSCRVALEAVPRLTHRCGTTALLVEFAVRRTVDLDEAMVLDAAPGHPAEAALSLLVGGGPGRPARFVVRVRA